MTLRRKKRKAEQQLKLQQQRSAPDGRMLFNDEQNQQLQKLQSNNESAKATYTQQQPANNEDVPLEQSAKVISFANPVINDNIIQQAMGRLHKYKEGKVNLEKRIVANEDYWKLRQWRYINDGRDNNRKNNIATAWLWNCITSKAADLIDGYPESNIRPKRADDVTEAKKLKDIIPVVLEENDYEKVYSSIINYMLKQGTAVIGVFWDGSLHDGLGDISIRKEDILELYWEPGVEDIQDSREVFHAKFEDNAVLERQYSELKGKLGGKPTIITEYHYDDNIDTTGKSLVIDWYYKKLDDNGNTILHYCKFCNGVVLFATENEPEKYKDGWFAHGMYPYIVTPLFPIEGSICGYGYVDIGRGDQEAIDILTNSILTNAKTVSKPRYFTKASSGVNESEFADFSKDFVHVQGSLDEMNIAPITSSVLPSFVVDMRDRLIDEMKETLGNRDVSNGGSTGGITAASAIATMQEQSGKISRMHNKTLYNMHKQLTYMIIELIRQFYGLPREYRITGMMGEDRFVQYSNAGLQPQQQPSILGIQMGLRKPLFDIEVSSQKSSPYSKMEQNELAIQLYNLGVFSPQNTDMALALLQTMDFSHKDDTMQLVAKNGTMYQKYQQLQKVAFQLAQTVDPAMAEQLAQAILMENGQNPTDVEPIKSGLSMPDINTDGTVKTEEHPFVQQARANAQESTQVNG